MPSLMDYASFTGPMILAGSSLVPTTGLLGSAKHIGLYFSAHWCGPCRKFTPTLAQAYKTLRGAGIEVLFVSADHTEAAFMEYYAQMPWKAVPFTCPRRAIGEMLGVQGIPKLIVLNSEGTVVTSEGVELLQSDPSGAALLRLLQPTPTPMPSPSPAAAPARLQLQAGPDRREALLALLGHKLLAGRSAVPTAALMSSAKYVGLYFSAHWCGPCRSCTPILAQCYASLRQQGMQVVFVSADRTETSFTEYYTEMPWKAMPFSCDRRAIGEHFMVEGIPKLIVLRACDASLVTTDGVDLLKSDPTGQALLQLLQPAARSKSQPLTEAEKPMSARRYSLAPHAEKVKKESPATSAAKLEEKPISRQKAEAALGTTLLTLLGPTLLHGAAASPTPAALRGAKSVALYFGEHSSAECQEFTSLLAKEHAFFQCLGMQVVYVSFEDTEAAFGKVYGEMPWMALPFDSPQRRVALRVKAKGLPQLLLLDLEGDVITPEGVQLLRRDPSGMLLGEKVHRHQKATTP